MIGGGPLLNETKRVVRALQLEDSVVVTGRLAEKDLISILQSSHINVHCAVTEGWCMSAMEAAACGVPTVAYRVPGVLDSVVHGRTGWLVDDVGPRALSMGIEKILQSGQNWTNQCRDYSMGFSWESCAERWNAHLQSLTSTEKTHPNMRGVGE
jgi:glycosyltransferase involved in cell wall biosynthesis